jgi:hypothetical protein
LLGRGISEEQRKIIALPLRYGGLAIQNPVLTSDKEFQASNVITDEVQRLIYNQDTQIEKFDRSKMNTEKQSIRGIKEVKLKSDFEYLKGQMPKNQQRALEQATHKGASSWLSALPLHALGYSLNKSEFRDSISLRYSWEIPDIHTHCACGAKNDIDHVMTCKKGGYVTFRHNALRDTEAELLREVCKDVRIEPPLLPTDKKCHPPSTNTQDQARLDIVATGLWGTFERTFFDVRVTHAGAKSNIDKPLDKLLLKNENEKKTKYSSRVINTEKSSFVPLVYSTAGSTAPECKRHHKRVAELISSKRNENYSSVINHIRTKIRFALLKSVLMAVRGIRGRDSRKCMPTAFIPFNLIPTEGTYECP